MKKVLKTAGALALAAFAFFAVSCSYQDVDNDNDNGVKTLDPPNVKGKAYPGVNYVYWEPVANASKGYDYFVYEDGTLKNSTALHTDVPYIVDSDLQYKVRKEYKVWATGDRSANRSAFYQEGRKGSVSLDSILPPYDTKPTELAKYENGYEQGRTYTLSNGLAQYQLSASSVTVKADDNNTGKFSVTFPAKAYLSYTIYADKGNRTSVFNDHESVVATFQDFAVNNKPVTVSGVVSTAGEYTITVKASSPNSNYVNPEEFAAAAKLTYNAYAISGTETAKNIKSSYKDGATVRVAWTPASDASGATLATTNYKVYRNVLGEPNYELVAGEIHQATVLGYNVPTYYFDDTVSGTSSYVYTFVATDGTNIAKYATTYTLEAYTSTIDERSFAVEAKYTESNTARVEWTPDVLADGSYALTTAYTVYRKSASDSNSSYKQLSGTVSSKTARYAVTGKEVTKYYIEDSVPNNTASYIYVLVYAGEDGTYKSFASLSSYEESTALSFDISSAAYKDESTVRVSWNAQRLSNGSVVPASSYSVFRKTAGADDSSYEQLAATVAEAKSALTSSSVFYVEDSVENNAVGYVYAVKFEDGSDVKVGTVSVAAYAATLKEYAFDVAASYKDESTVRVIWEPAKLESGKEVAEYAVYRKTAGSDDSSYSQLSATVASTRNRTGSKVFYIEDSITDNSVSYVYIVTYQDGTSLYKSSEKSVPVYSKASVLGEPVISFFAKDDDGIANDAKITLNVDALKSVKSVKYLVISSSDTAKYLASDYTTELALSDENKTEDGYEWIISDVEAESYVAVAVVSDSTAKYAVSSTVSGTEPEEPASTDNFNVTVTLIDADGDGNLNDAKVAVARPANTAAIAAKYGTGATEDDAEKAAEAGTSIALDGNYVLYITTVKDAVSNEGDYFAVALTVSETGKKDSVVYGSAEYTVENSDIFNINVTTPEWRDNDSDKKDNDIYFRIARTDRNNGALISNLTFNVTYATSEESSEDAKALLKTSSAKTLTETALKGSNFYEFNSEKYPVLKDIGGDGYIYFAVRVTVSQANKKDVTIDVVTETPSVDNDDHTAKSPDNVKAELVSLTKTDDGTLDGEKNDLKVTFDLGIDQKVGGLCYIASDPADFDFNGLSYGLNDLIKDRLNTKGSYTEIPVEKAKELYRTDERAYYEASFEADVEAGKVVAVQVYASEEGKKHKGVKSVAGLVTAAADEVEATAEPSVYARGTFANSLYFESDDDDSNYNDISDTISVTVGINQYIKAIGIAQAPVLDDAKTIAASGDVSNANYKTITVPAEFNLNTTVNRNTATLTKTYTFEASLKDVEDGNYAVLAVEVEETGKNPAVGYVSTTSYTRRLDNYIYDRQVSFPATAAQLAVFAPIYSVTNNDGSRENELVHVTVYDSFYGDSVDNYTYTLERTTEKLYETKEDKNDPSIVWETVEDNIGFADNYTSYSYGWDKYYKCETAELDGSAQDVAAETTYVYRLTKTRKAEKSERGKAEDVVLDEKITPEYVVEAPSLSFESYKNGTVTVVSATETFDKNFDYFEKYNYTLRYHVVYESGNNNNVETAWKSLDISNSWTEGTDINGNATASLTAEIKDDFSSSYNGTSYNNATLEVELTKTHVEKASKSDTSSVDVLLKWDGSVKIVNSSELTLRYNDYSSYYYFNANLDGYSSASNWKWYVDGNRQSGESSSYFSLTKSILSAGSHEVMVTVNRNGKTYSASAVVVIEQ